MQVTSFRVQWVVLAAFAAFSALGCDDGGDSGDGGDDTGSNNMPPPTTTLTPISNLEGDTGTGSGYFVDVASGYEGAWFTYNDATSGTQSPEAMAEFAVGPGGHDSSFAANTVGNGFTEWGAGMGFNIRVAAEAGSPLEPAQQCGGPAPCTFDASAYSGLSFWAKLGEGAANGSVRLKVIDEQTSLAANGGTCADASICGDNFGAPLSLTADWQYFEFTWEQLKQEGWGPMKGGGFPGIQRDKFIGVQWQVAKGVSFDYWVDDVAFTTP